MLSLLSEVNGDVEMAAMRISEGQFHWNMHIVADHAQDTLNSGALFRAKKKKSLRLLPRILQLGRFPVEVVVEAVVVAVLVGAARLSVVELRQEARMATS